MKHASLVAIVLGSVLLSAACKKDKPTPSAGSADPSGSSAVTPAAVDARPPPPVDAPPPPPPADAAAAAPADPLTAVCPKLLAKIVECVDDKDFIAALMKDADAKKKKIVKQLLGEVADWTANQCTDMAASYEYQGFTNKWDQVSDPAILESCAKLGAAVQAAGGLFGGDQAM